MNLYLVHCGFYDSDTGFGIYESHTNYLIVATDFKHARKLVMQKEGFKNKKMHIDGVQEIQVVSGYQIQLAYQADLNNADKIVNYRHRDLASSPV